MIVTDTTVVIDYTRGRDAKLVSLVPTLPVAICGITRAEVLAGAQNPGHRRNLQTILGTFQQVVIATVGRALGVEVWPRARQFPLMQSVLPALKLFREPP